MKSHLAGVGLLLAATVAAAYVVAVVGWGQPDIDVGATNEQPPTVTWVLPGGPVWNDGVRPGQTVTSITSGIYPADWAMATTDGIRGKTTSERAIQLAMRDWLPVAILALVVCLAAWLAIRRLQIATALAALAVAISAQALLSAGMPIRSTAVGAAAVALPPLWLWLWSSRTARLRLVVSLVAGLIALAWVAARWVMPGLYDFAELARVAAIVIGLLLVAAVLIEQRGWRQALLNLEGRRAADLFAVTAVLAVIIVVAVLTEVPLVALVLVGGIALLAYPAVRRRLGATIDELVLSEVRGRASLAAVEDERGRIARELHDAPLQEVAAVIRDLDRHPGTEKEADMLRQAAGHLRRVTTELRPPVLDDLGLPAALQHVVAQASARAPDVEIESDITPVDLYSARAPAEVELAVFRVVQEAVENALRHSGATLIRVVARVGPTEVDASVADNGHGMAAGAARAALQAGHLGLVTMAQRAELIGAEFSTQPTVPHGTLVRVHWQAKR
jgi:signal transduction histidine kinase